MYLSKVRVGSVLLIAMSATACVGSVHSADGRREADVAVVPPDDDPVERPVLDAGPPVTEQFASECLKRDGAVTKVSGLQQDNYSRGTVPGGTIFDASDAFWNGVTAAGSPIPWVITLNGEASSCWYGSVYRGVWDDTSPDVTWQNPYHHSGAFTIRAPSFLVEGLRSDNQGDGVRMEGGASDFHIRGVYLSNMHDDCIENDFLHAGVLEDSLLDGCYVGFSADDFTSEHDGSANTWEIKNNLVYIKDMPTVYTGPAPASGMLFKGWQVSAPGPALVLKNNIFRADNKAGLSVHSSGATLTIPKNVNLAECENNTFVWLGEGDFPNPLPDCFTVTTDKSVWDEAVAKWKADHRDIEQ